MGLTWHRGNPGIDREERGEVICMNDQEKKGSVPARSKVLRVHIGDERKEEEGGAAVTSSEREGEGNHDGRRNTDPHEPGRKGIRVRLREKKRGQSNCVGLDERLEGKEDFLLRHKRERKKKPRTEGT